MVPKISSGIEEKDYSIKTFTSFRYGRKCKVPPVRSNIPERVKTLRYATISLHGVQLFNMLPRCIREITDITIDDFKTSLDIFLGTIPDEPLLNGYTARRRKESNSLLHMI